MPFSFSIAATVPFGRFGLASFKKKSAGQQLVIPFCSKRTKQNDERI